MNTRKRLDRLERARLRKAPAPRYAVRWPNELTTDEQGNTIIKATGEPWSPAIVLRWPEPPTPADN